MKHNLFTIGHSTHTLSRFMDLLNLYAVQEVWDVRSQPYSKYNKAFNKECIERELSKNNMVYSFMGYELGGRTDNPACYDENNKLQYRRVAQLPVFQTALSRIKNKLKTCGTALMCSENDPLNCHRMILICRELCQKTDSLKKEIKHILFDGSIRTNKEMERLLMDKFKLYPDMFRTEKECIEEAYNRQAHKIAYTYKESAFSHTKTRIDQSKLFAKSIEK